jgi:hypothetical protein
LIFGAVFVGATIVTFNTRILGGKITYFQSVSILGYCIFPLFIILMLFKVFVVFNFNNFTVRVIGIIIASIWCVYCNNNMIKQRKHLLLLILSLKRSWWLFIR